MLQLSGKPEHGSGSLGHLHKAFYLREVTLIAYVRLMIGMALAAIVTLTCGYAENHAAPAVKIGAILPLSGAASNFGAIARRGIELALEDLSPEDRARVSVVYEDDGLSNARSATAARKLLTIDKVDALLTWSSGTGLTVAGIAEAKRIPHVSIASDPAVAKGRTYSFTYWPIPEDEVRVLKEHLTIAKIKRVAVISQVHNGILAIRDEFLRQVKEDDSLVVVANEEVAGDVTDFRTVLERMRAKGDFDGFIPIFFPGQLSVCIKQARSLGITAKLFGFETFEDKDEIKAAAGSMTGAVYATGGDPKANFIQRYETKYPGESYYTANQAYDIINVYIDASRKTKDGASIVAYLKALKHRETASGVVNVTESNQFRLPTTLKEIGEDGVPRPLARSH